jgi:hypothetical protein
MIEDYLEKIHSSIPVDETDLMLLDALLTDAFMLLGSHLYYGKVDPEKAGANWELQCKDPNLRLDLELEEALIENEVVQKLNMLAPATGPIG